MFIQLKEKECGENMAEYHRNYLRINVQWLCMVSVCVSMCLPLQIVQAVTEINARQTFKCGYHGYLNQMSVVYLGVAR